MTVPPIANLGYLHHSTACRKVKEYLKKAHNVLEIGNDSIILPKKRCARLWKLRNFSKQRKKGLISYETCAKLELWKRWNRFQNHMRVNPQQSF